MTKKLIDWAQCPSGVFVINTTDKSDQYVGEFIGWVTTKTALIKRLKSSKSMRIDVVSIAPCLTKKLRLTTADQQPWLVYERGMTVIPEWAEVNYKYYYWKPAQIGITDVYTATGGMAFAYRLANGEKKLLKEGWADNPSEATE